MDTMRGALRKMMTTAETPIAYRLPVGDSATLLNLALGKTVRIDFLGEIYCIGCGRKTSKSFNQGYCYPCFRGLARCDLCFVKPELCHYARGTCREPEWGLANCMQPHYVYLAQSSSLKVGITRAHQIPVRWIDQGAVQALPFLRVQSRHQAGLLEVAMKKYVNDRTDWRRMLRGEPEFSNLIEKRDELLALCSTDIEKTAATAGEGRVAILPDEAPQTFTYPILHYPAKITALDLNKTPKLAGTLLGIKGQYLLFDIGVLNIRKFAGHLVAVTV